MEDPQKEMSHPEKNWDDSFFYKSHRDVRASRDLPIAT
jgi:hypothetical protein